MTREPDGCRETAERLGRYLAGALGERERERLERHLERCDACSELHAERAALLADGGTAAEGLVEAVLARTSGPACRSARERLPDWADGALEAADADLLRSHLERCDPCRGLAAALARMGRELPLVAELDPGAEFTRRVLRRTAAAARRRRFARRVARVATRLAAWWHDLLRRPRFALEASYVGAIALFLIFGTSASPLAGVPRRMLELATLNPVGELRAPGERLQSGVSDRVDRAWRATRARARSVSSATRETADEVTAFSERALDRLQSDLGTLWHGLASGEENETTASPPTEEPTRPESHQGDRS